MVEIEKSWKNEEKREKNIPYIHTHTPVLYISAKFGHRSMCESNVRDESLLTHVFRLVIRRVNLPPILIFLLCKMYLWIPPYFIVYKSLTFLSRTFVAARNMTTCEDRTRRYRRAWEWHSIYCNLCTLIMWKGPCMAKEVCVFHLDSRAKKKLCVLWRNREYYKRELKLMLHVVRIRIHFCRVFLVLPNLWLALNLFYFQYVFKDTYSGIWNRLKFSPSHTRRTKLHKCSQDA